MRSVRVILVCVTILVVAAVGLYVADKYAGLSIFDNLFGKGMQYEKTANVITEIRNISEFTSACYYEELVMAEVKDSENTTNKVVKMLGRGAVSKDEICLIMDGKVRAGFDLSKVTDNAIAISGDTLTMTLPKPEIFDVIVNPSNCEVYVEEGKWSHEQVTTIQASARVRIQDDAIGYGILEQADKIGRERLADLFKTFGFSVVRLN